MTVTAEEPRRSGRSTKGQHTKNDLLEPTITAKKQGRRSSSATTSKKRTSQEPTPTSDAPSASATPEPGRNAADGMGGVSENEADGNGNGEDEEEIIRCICGEYEEEEDIERDMICCDNCSAWQHNDCMGLSFPKGQEPEQYFCEKCRPENHKELLAKIERGERPWEEAARLRSARIAELKKKKKGKKGGRKGSAKSGSQKATNTESSPDTENGTVKREESATAASVKNATPTTSSTSAKAASPSPVTPIATSQVDGQGQGIGSASHRKRKSEYINTGANQPAVKQQRLLQDQGSPTLAIQQQPVAFPAPLPSAPPPPAAVPAPVSSAPLQQATPVTSFQAGGSLPTPSQVIPTTWPVQPQQQYQQVPQVVMPIPGQGQQQAQAQSPTNYQAQQPTEQPVVTQEAAPPPRPPSQQELLDSLNPARRNVANALAKLFADAIPDSIKRGAFLLPPTLTVPQAGVTFALAVEYSMYKNLCQGVGEIKEPYKQQMRTILFNVKRNPALLDGILSGAISADRLSTMSTKDMASKEQRMREDEIKKEAERQHIIVQEEGPRIRRTHKGEEVIEDDTQPVVNESIFSNAPRRGTITSVQSGESGKEKGHVSPRRKSPSPEPADDIHQHQDHDGHYDNEGTTKGTRGRHSHSPGADHEARFGAPSDQHFPFPFPHDQPPVSRAEADAEIDALLGDDDNNEEPYSPPYSPKEFIDDSDNFARNHTRAIVWTGTLSMASFTQFHCEARHVGGADLSERVSWQDLMPPTLVIDGRIDVKLATNYLCGLRFSQTTDVCVTAISAPTQPRERTEFDRIFEYFAQRNRYGVIGKHTNAFVKDTYVVPVEKQNGGLSGGDSAVARRPEFLDLLENNSVEDPVQERLLLVVFVVRNGEMSVANTPSLGGQGGTLTGSVGSNLQMPSQQTGNTGGRAQQASESRRESTNTAVSTQAQLQAQPPQQQLASSVPQPSTISTTTPNPAMSMLPTTTATTLPPTSTTTSTQHQSAPNQVQSSVPSAVSGSSNGTAPSTSSVARPVTSTNPLHAQIFGKYVTSPAVTELLTRAPNADATQLGKVAALIAANPAAASDYLLLAQLIVGSERQGSGQ